MEGDNVMSARRDKVLVIEAGLPRPKVRPRVQRRWIRAYDRASVHFCVQHPSFGFRRRDFSTGLRSGCPQQSANSNNTTYW